MAGWSARSRDKAPVDRSVRHDCQGAHRSGLMFVFDLRVQARSGGHKGGDKVTKFHKIQGFRIKFFHKAKHLSSDTSATLVGLGSVNKRDVESRHSQSCAAV